MHTYSRLMTRIAALSVFAITWHSESARSEDQPKTRKAPKIEYIRYEVGNDPAKASRDFDANGERFSLQRHGLIIRMRRDEAASLGRGLLRIYVDESSRVTDVKVLKSTGNQLLDAAGLTAFRHWRAKSGIRREVDMPLTFVMGGPQNRSGDNGMGKDGLGIMKSRDR